MKLIFQVFLALVLSDAAMAGAVDVFVDCDFKVDSGEKIRIYNDGMDPSGQTKLTFQFAKSNSMIGTYLTKTIADQGFNGFLLEYLEFSEGNLMLITSPGSTIKSGILTLNSGSKLSNSLKLKDVELSCSLN